MARPLATPDAHRSGNSGAFNIRAALAEAAGAEPHTAANGKAHPVATEEVDALRTENAELRALCQELEQALQESSQRNTPADWDERIREYDLLLEEKNEVIRKLHSDLQTAQCAIAEAEAAAQTPAKRGPAGPLPREEELLALSEDLERERRQLQEDEQTLMDQMREMEVSMARERAEMGRQRNDLQRLQAEIRHELERLERNGALQSKIDGLKSKLQDVSSRRGSAPTARPTQQTPPAQEPAAANTPPKKKDGLMGRLFG